MSRQILATAIPVGLAVLGGALAVATGGVSLGPTLFLAADAGLVVGLGIDYALGLFKQKGVQNSTPVPNLQFASSQEGYPVQVGFGTFRVTGNYLMYNPNMVGQSAIMGSSGGGGGGLLGSGGGSSSQQVIGYIYYCPFEYGLCMGPIDGVGEVYTSPNAAKVRDLKQTVLGGGRISGTGGTNIIVGSGTNFTASCQQNTIIRLTNILTDTTSLAFTVKNVIDAEHVQVYEAIEFTFLSKPYTVRDSTITTTPFTGDYLNLRLIGRASEGGNIRIYQGNSTQTRVVDRLDPWSGVDNPMYYRNVCYVVFTRGYQLGQEAAAKTYLFELQRFPKCYLDDGTDAGITTRGSLDPKNICYQDANPAAIYWEMFTNKIWGLGRSSSELNVADFQQASYALAEANIGMSFALDQASNMSDALQTIQQATSLAIWYDGTQIRCRWLYDLTGNSYQIKVQLTRSQLTDFKHTTPAWGTQVNEVRAQFTNRMNYYSPEIVHLQDLAGIKASGAVKSGQLNFNGFGNPDVATRMAQRALKESAYRLATIQFTMNRWDSTLKQFDLFSIYWDEWTPQPYTSYYRCLSVQHNEDEQGSITVTAVRDVSYLPRLDSDPPLSKPYFPFTDMPSQPGGQSILPVDPNPSTDITPIGALEMNCYQSQLAPRAAFVIEQRSDNVIGATISWSDLGAATFTGLGTISCIGCTGQLGAGGYPITNILDRGPGFIMVLNNTDDLDTILAADLVQSTADSFETLLATEQFYVLIDQEIMQVGNAIDNGDGSVTFQNVVRGLFSTPIQNHAANATAFFIPEFSIPNYTVPLTGMDSEALNGTPQVEFSVLANTSGDATDPVQAFINPDETVKYLANRPFPPQQYPYSSPTVLSGTPGTTTFAVAFSFRNRAITMGADVDSLAQEFNRIGTTLDPDTQFLVQQFDNTGTQIGTGYDTLAISEVLVDGGTDPTKGRIDVPTYTCQPAAKTLKVWSVVNGWQSVDYLLVNLGV